MYITLMRLRRLRAFNVSERTLIFRLIIQVGQNAMILDVVQVEVLEEFLKGLIASLDLDKKLLRV